nr:hypothetical protein Ade03nite_09030 [Actinoplanes derwentensis]
MGNGAVPARSHCGRTCSADLEPGLPQKAHRHVAWFDRDTDYLRLLAVVADRTVALSAALTSQPAGNMSTPVSRRSWREL